MFNKIEPINLINGLNLNPIPLETSQAMTTSKQLFAIQAKLNEVILIRNEVVEDANSYSDGKYNVLFNELNNLKEMLNGGDIIPNGSIGLEKLKSDFSQQFNNIVVDTVKNVAQFVWFGINDNGYFYASIPESWNNIIFDTDLEGHLILQY